MSFIHAAASLENNKSCSKPLDLMAAFGFPNTHLCVCPQMLNVLQPQTKKNLLQDLPAQEFWDCCVLQVPLLSWIPSILECLDSLGVELMELTEPTAGRQLEKEIF